MRASSLLAALSMASSASAAEIVAPPDLPSADVWVRTDGGSIRVLDKQKAQSQLLTLKAGETATFESLSLTLLACVSRPPDVPQNAAAFLQVTDNRPGEPGFRGWMFSGQPGLATLESPVYAVRVVGCVKPTDAQLAQAVPPKPAAPAPASTPASALSPAPASAPASAPAVPPVTRRPSASDLNPPPGQDLDNPSGQ